VTGRGYLFGLLAVARAAADSLGVPLYRYLGGIGARLVARQNWQGSVQHSDLFTVTSSA